MTSADDDRRLDFPATARNRDAILDVLRRVLPPDGDVLEIASGSGQHAVYFQNAMPDRVWRTSDPDPANRASIAAWIAAERPAMPAPLDLDAAAARWDVPAEADPRAVVCINMIHIAPWECGLGLIRNAAAVLPAGGVLYLYGAYKVGGRHTAESNARFDASLRAQNPAWGVRNLDDVALEARRAGFQLAETVRMPSNNLSVVFLRGA